MGNWTIVLVARGGGVRWRRGEGGGGSRNQNGAIFTSIPEPFFIASVV